MYHISEHHHNSKSDELLAAFHRASETSRKPGICEIFTELEDKDGQYIHHYLLQNPHILKNLGIERWFLSHGDQEGNASFHGNLYMGQTLYVYSHYHASGKITDFFYMLPKDAPGPIASSLGNTRERIENII